MTENILDNLFTPKQLAEKGVLSLVTQWSERDKGRLKFCQIGRKILYTQAHITDYLALCEREAQTNLSTKKAE